MSDSNYLFFSNKSHECLTLMTLMRNENLLQYFNPICTDKGWPNGINVIPTIIIRNSQTKIENADCFKWLCAIKQWKQNMLLSQFGNEYNSYSQSIGNNLNMNSSVIGYSASEMGGFSDSFALLQTDDALPQSFVDYEKKLINNDKLLIFTPPSEEKKIDDEAQGKMVRKILKERDEFDRNHKSQLNKFLESGR